MLRPAIFILSNSSLDLANRIALGLDGEVHGFSKRVTQADIFFDNVGAHLTELFLSKRIIIAIMATGAVIRLLAPHIHNKHGERALICVSADGASVVPLLAGHQGANNLADTIARLLGGHAAITTAGDVCFGLALDEPAEGYVLANPDQTKEVMARLVNGASVSLTGEAPWLSNSNLAFKADGEVHITISEKLMNGKTSDLADGKELVYYQKSLVVGVGCERGCSAEELYDLTEQTLQAYGFAMEAVGIIASIDLKADEGAIHALANEYNCQARFFNASRLLDETDNLRNPSDIVFDEVGCYGVAEGAALAGAGDKGELLVEKQKSKRATVAIGRAVKPFIEQNMPGQKRGQLNVVGIGPGTDAWRSPEVSRMISQSTDLVGYSLYLDLLGSLASGKRRHDFDLGKEEARVRHAMELAGEGRDVALVCSGDAGIYAMATLVFELLDNGNENDQKSKKGEKSEKDGLSQQARRINIAVSPGISALQAAAARIGAPLGHDFCTISLSDILTPWDHIKTRISAAAKGDFVIAFYNPVSMRRRTQLAWARDCLLKTRSASTPVILASNLGREGEKVRVVELEKLDINMVDMLTLVIVGSSESKSVKTGDGKTWIYTPRGYSGKAGSIMEAQQ